MLSYFFEGLTFDFLDLVIGFVVLIKGAEFLVAGASSIARKNGISDIAIGLTVVAFGTSLPELIVSLISALSGKTDTAFGNALGSNNFNLLLILGVSGLIYPLVVQRNTVRYEVPISVLTMLLLLLLVNDHWIYGAETATTLSRRDGIVLLIGFAGFLFYIARTMRNVTALQEGTGKTYKTIISVVMIFSGIAMLVGGGSTVVSAATDIAHHFGMSDKLIGLTILAAGTSLPELATSAVAAYKKNTDIAIGNVIGSNIFNILFILGVTGVVAPIPFNTGMNFDIGVTLGGTLALMLFMFTLSQRKLDRLEAFLLLTGFIVYTVYLVSIDLGLF